MEDKLLIKIFNLGSILFLLSLFSIQLIANPVSGEDVINVPNDYSTIQLAIANANNNDTIFVEQGTYFENIVINKSITLFGENKITTIIDGKRSGNIITISAPSVKIQGFTIQNAGNDGIHINSNTNHISNNILSNNDNHAIFLTFSHYSTIIDNTISNNKHGIRLDDSNYNNVTNNLISTNSGNAIYLSNSVNTNISGNEITYNTRPIHISSSSNNNLIADNIISYNDNGIYCHDCNSNLIEHNEFIWNEGFTLYFTSSKGNNVSNNIISNSQRGIGLRDSSFNIIIQNNITDNSLYGIYMYSGTSNNFIYHNNFIKNNEHVYDKYENNWDNGYPSGGNYWDDYTGIDANGDGIGDTPYIISDAENQDRFPLIEPWKGKVQSDSQLPDIPTPISPGSITEPGDSINNFTPTFQWNEVPNADYYAFYISRYPYGSENLVFDSETDVGSIYETSFNLPDGILAEDGKYRWNMRANNSIGWSDFSEKLYFKTSNSESSLDLTPTGFYYPTGKAPTRSEPKYYGYYEAVTYYNYAGWLARGDENDYPVKDSFHIAQDIEGNENDPVYAISDGVIVWVSANDWGNDENGNINYGILVKHKAIIDGVEKDFIAVYGHVKPIINLGKLEVSESKEIYPPIEIEAGQQFAELDRIFYNNAEGYIHLHFGIRQKYDNLPPPGPYGIMKIEGNWSDINSKPENTNEFVDPIKWIETKNPYSQSSNIKDNNYGPETPGFELVFIILALVIIVHIKRRRKVKF